MRLEFDKTVVEHAADGLHRRIYWLRCVLATGHKPDGNYGPFGGRTICHNCGCWVRAMSGPEFPPHAPVTTRDGIATGLSRALVALEAYDYEPFERKGMEQAIHLVRSLLEATVD